VRQVADIQPNIVEAFGDIDKLPWLAAAFTLPAATLVLPWSKAYSIFNIKWLYCAHVTLFEVGSAIAGAAPNMNALIVGRAIAGVGGCGMYIGGLTYFSIMTTPKERPIYVSLITPVWGLGTVLGPVVGGGFAVSSVTWRWGFYINLLIAAVFAPTMLLHLPSFDFQATASLKDKFKQIDLLGTTLFTGFGVAFIMAIAFGGSVYAWNSGSEIALWVVTGVLLIAFILSQIFHPFVEEQHKLYPTKLQRNLKVFNLQFQTFAAAGIVYVRKACLCLSLSSNKNTDSNLLYPTLLSIHQRRHRFGVCR
jgi:MFS family permease